MTTAPYPHPRHRGHDRRERGVGARSAAIGRGRSAWPNCSRRPTGWGSTRASTGARSPRSGRRTSAGREWDALHREISAALADDAVDGVIVTHGTDTAEETAFLLDLTLPAGKPVVLVGAMRPADAVGSDGMRNLANAVRVAGDPAAAGRGVLVVMSDQVFAAIDVRKAATGGRRGVSRVSARADRQRHADFARLVRAAGPRGRAAARFAWPSALPKVGIVYGLRRHGARTRSAARSAAGRRDWCWPGWGRAMRPRR